MSRTDSEVSFYFNEYVYRCWQVCHPLRTSPHVFPTPDHLVKRWSPLPGKVFFCTSNVNSCCARSCVGGCTTSSQFTDLDLTNHQVGASVFFCFFSDKYVTEVRAASGLGLSHVFGYVALLSYTIEQIFVFNFDTKVIAPVFPPSLRVCLYLYTQLCVWCTVNFYYYSTLHYNRLMIGLQVLKVHVIPHFALPYLVLL